VLDRYGAEIWRVTGVIDATLKKSGGEWLVGDKCSYADLSFVPWYWLCPAIMGEGFNKVSFPGLSSQSVRDVLTVLFFFVRNGSPSTRLVGPGTRGCRLGLRSRRPGRTERRRWPSDRQVGTETGEMSEAPT